MIYVVPDIHGNYELLARLLDINDGEYPVVQIGDLMNVVVESISEDSRCLTLVEDSSIDIHLVGNHEHCLLGGGKFGGAYIDPEIQTRYNALYRRGKVRACYIAGKDLLITHAGIVRELEDKPQYKDAVNAGISLEDLWRLYPTADIFDNCGYARYGIDPYSGILWADFDEAKTRNFNQLVGHTVSNKKPPRTRHHPTKETWVTCMDWGGKHGKGAACYVDEGKIVKWEYVELEAN